MAIKVFSNSSEYYFDDMPCGYKFILMKHPQYIYMRYRNSDYEVRYKILEYSDGSIENK